MNISNSLKMAGGYLTHLVTAGNEHSIHSPFVFSLLTRAVYLRNIEPEFSKIESIRKQLLKDKTSIPVTDLGAGSSFNGKLTERSIADIAGKFAKSKNYGRLLYRLSSYFKPASIIELGTSLGISTMYLSSGSLQSAFYTMEGCPATSAKAASLFSSNGFSHIKCITGNFDDTLPVLLEQLGKVDFLFIDGNHTFDATLRYFDLAKKYTHNGTVIIFDDINWSAGMQKAWQRIISDTGITVSIDFFFMGIVFFDQRLTKQHFKLRC